MTRANCRKMNMILPDFSKVKLGTSDKVWVSLLSRFVNDKAGALRG